jgi:hypothetical protein
MLPLARMGPLVESLRDIHQLVRRPEKSLAK